MEAQSKSNETGLVEWAWPENETTTVTARQAGRRIEIHEGSTPVYIDFMPWAKNTENTRSGVDEPPTESFDTLEHDEDAEDRIALLAMKYASSLHRLSPEENARLQILNHSMDIENPRYTAEDWDILAEGAKLLKELALIRGN